MSSDLFAAFGSPELSNGETEAVADLNEISRSVNSGVPRETKFANPNSLIVEDEDEFGDFEDASAPAVTISTQEQIPANPAAVNTASNLKKKPLPFSSPPPKHDSPQVGRHPFADHMDLLFSADDENDDYNAGADEMMDLSTNPQAAMEYSKRIIAQQQAEQEARGEARAVPDSQARASPPVQSSPQSNSIRGPQQITAPKPARDPNVLFDADDPSDIDDDDFGDFEAGDVPPTFEPVHVIPQTHTVDLLALDDQPVAPTQNTSSQQTQHLSDRTRTSRSTSKAKTMVIPKPDPETFNDDTWDDFEDGLPTINKSPASTKPANNLPKSTAAVVSAPAKPRTASSLPPTNVPPPSILLSIFPSLFTQANEALFTPLSKASTNDRQILISHPASRKFLANHLMANVVLGHIIAGRKLRWKRDQYLAQGMRIGPAAAGGKGGMKLAGVDKSEVAREDREVLDVVRSWKAQSGKLRSAVTALNTVQSTKGSSKLPAVPEIAESLPVKVLKATEGGFVAPHACALCGLKREERVAKVDVDVDDSFGEWWVNGMSMHLACKNFWHEHEGLLRSR